MSEGELKFITQVEKDALTTTTAPMVERKASSGQVVQLIRVRRCVKPCDRERANHARESVYFLKCWGQWS